MGRSEIWDHMKTLIELYIRRFGLDDGLVEMAAGIQQVACGYPDAPEPYRRMVLDAAEAVYRARNEFDKQERRLRTANVRPPEATPNAGGNE
jgi:hypothetical protein